MNTIGRTLKLAGKQRVFMPQPMQKQREYVQLNGG
jgi:hypothetical protein